MTTPVTLEFLGQELALVRTELRCIIETLCRLDETHTHLDQRLIAMRDEVQDAQSAMRSVRAELAAHHRLQDQIGKRLHRLEQTAALGTKGKTQ
jgi:chromosome segregation ATPase